MKVALIHCPFEHKIFSENFKVVDEKFCLAPPIILAYVAAILEKTGHQVIIIDAKALKITLSKTLQILKQFSPDMIGFRVDTYWFHRVVEWAQYLKMAMNIPVVVGGINVSLYPEETFAYSCFDYGIRGEANESLPQLIEALEGKRNIENIKGIIYRDRDKIVMTPLCDNLINFNDYPYPARHLLPNHLYYSFTSQRKNYTIMLTSTGCLYKCKFCTISKLSYRERTPKNVVDEIEQCYTQYSVREIDFFDANFFMNKKRVIEICKEMMNRGIEIEWSCRSRVDMVDDEILRISAQAGCKKIYYGIESVSQDTLININKGITKEQVISTIELTHKHRINTLGFFMIGNIGDTKERVFASIKFAKRLKLDFVQVCRAIAKPNTDYNNILLDNYGEDYWKNYILGIKKESRLPNPWTDLSQKELDQYTRKFYRDFYFRPSYILKRICKVKSIDELLRYITTFLTWLFCNQRNI